jgi:hypothetical protein
MTEVSMQTANPNGDDYQTVLLKVDLCVFEIRSCLHVSSKDVKERNQFCWLE